MLKGLITPVTLMAVAIFTGFVAVCGLLEVALHIFMHLRLMPTKPVEPSMWVVWAVMGVATVLLLAYRRKLIRKRLGHVRGEGFSVVPLATTKDETVL